MKFLIHTLDEFGKTQMGGLYMYMPEIINLFFFTFFMFLPFQENGPYFSGNSVSDKCKCYLQIVCVYLSIQKFSKGREKLIKH